jgi:OmpA-OmpF porin, OOP family
MRFLLTLSTALFSFFSSAQNLVPNPGFEEHHEGGEGFANIYLARHWLSANPGTPDYYNLTLSKKYSQGQEPHSGNAFAGLIVLDKYEDVVEYLQVKLLDTLARDCTYELEMYVSLSSGSRLIPEKLQAYLSPVRDRIEVWKMLKVQPQMHFRTDTQQAAPGSWFRISATYKAKGGEKYLTFGNFTPSRLLKTSSTNLPYSSEKDILSYYFVDDVQLRPLCEIRQRKPASAPSSAIFSIENIHFHFNEARLTESSCLRLDTLLSVLRADTSIRLEIIGHTDGMGSDIFNKRLSQSRARAVAEYLHGRGISRPRVRYSGRGKDEPLSTNSTDKGRQLNRRVEFILKKL